MDYGFRTVVQVARELRREGKPCLLEAIHIAVREAGKLKDFEANPGGFSAFLADLFINAPTSVGWEYFANSVSNKAALRNLRRAAAELIRECNSPTASPAELAAQHTRAVEEAVADRNVGEPVAFASAVARGAEGFSARRSQTRGKVRFGLSAVDSLIPSCDPGTLTYVAARTSVGKTAFVMTTALHNAVLMGAVTYYASLEMSAQEIGERALLMMTLEPGQKYRMGQASEEEIRSLHASVRSEAEATRLWIDDSSALTVEQIAAAARRLKRKQGRLDLICIDYVQIVSTSNPRLDRREHVEHVSRSLKRLARELEVPVICAAQLNRTAENRNDGKPKLSDLRESGALEQDADIVAMLWRPPGQDKRDEIQTIGCSVEKHRNGPCGEVELSFRRSCSVFEDKVPSL
jgi:replicative DNA helicase